MSEARYEVADQRGPFFLIRRRIGHRVRYRVVGFDGRLLYPAKIDEDHSGRSGFVPGDTERDRALAIEAVGVGQRWMRLQDARELFLDLSGEAQVFTEALGIGQMGRRS
jgi:hypothetical protein